MQKLRRIMKNPYNWFLGTLIILNTLPILAPVFLKLSETMPIFYIPMKLIYFAYSFTCHQFHHRSLHIFDHQYAWCTRDMGIWLTMLAIALLVKFNKVKGIRWYWVIPFLVPIALDGGIQTVATLLEIKIVGVSGDPLYMSSNFVRFATGAIFGAGIALWLMPVLYKGFNEKYLSQIEQKLGALTTRAQMRNFGLAIIALFGLYIGLVGLWSLTSPQYPPSDILDTVVRTPAVDFYTRRETAVCPSTEDDMLNLNCFFQ